MPNLERKTKSEVQTDFDVSGYSLGEILEYVKTYINNYGADAKVENYRPMYEEYEYLAIMKQVPETDAEYNKRIALETKYEEIAKQRDIAEFERLKKKFGDV